MSTVLVTGASGFVGRATAAALLAAGHSVTGTARRADRVPPGVASLAVDLLADPTALPAAIRTLRPEILVHGAWTTEHGRYWNDPANLDWAARTLEIVRAFADAGGRRIVTVGTCAEYDWAALDGTPCREASTPLRPHTLYGAAKHATADLVGAFCRSTGLAHAHARLFMLYGDGEQPARLVPGLIHALLAGRPARVTSGRLVRDLMDVRDAGAALAALAGSDWNGAVNVATGEPVTLAEVATTVGQLVGHPELVELGALPDRPDDPAFLVADVDILVRNVGFRPTIALRQGLDEAVSTWRAERGATDHDRRGSR
ncbi:MAG: NAD(P)-dependent oxidoreductase [Thalassobaculum sp.]|uniref:NAD-dependent epimerase/dehydratase family protein n=1 Tax=Thalassobaculum sp. TaxID=2022740 RepID=UPI0032EAF687